MLDTARLESIRDGVAVRSWRDLGLEDLARAAGLTRMTLYRRGITKETIAAGLIEMLVAEYQAASLPALVSSAPAPERLRMLLTAYCGVSERYLGVMDALGEGVASGFHEPGDGDVLTRPHFTEAVRRILEDGARDGSLVAGADVSETATLVFNATTWTYQHMRVGHRWSPEQCSAQVVRLLVDGLGA